MKELGKIKFVVQFFLVLYVGASMLIILLSIPGKHQEAENVIRTSFQNGLELDTVAYNTFINATLEAG